MTFEAGLQFTDEQVAIIAHPPGQSARILAGPGTGKSFTAVAYLERLTDAHPDLQSRMLTFTRAATDEFAQKMGDAGLAGLGVAVPATVHSFALSLLLRLGAPGLPSPLRIPDSWETKNLIHPSLSRRLRALGHAAATPTIVSRLEQEMAAGWQVLDPEQPLLAEEHPELGLAYRGVWNAHRQTFAYTLLAELPFRAGVALNDIGTSDTVSLDVLVVDEYQDLNEADIQLVSIVHQLGTDVVAIGDDDQSIYRWRMAAPEGIRRFVNDFGAADYPLTISRRCGRAIIEAANSLIQTAPDRAAKPPLVVPGDGHDGRFAYLRFQNTQSEAAGIARVVSTCVRDGVDPAEIAILVRSRPDTWRSVLEPPLNEQGIPLANAEWVVDVLGEEGIRRAIAFGHLVTDREDSLAWWALLEGLTVGVGPAFVDYACRELGEDERFGAGLLRLHGEGFPGSPASAARAAAEIAETLTLLDQLDYEGAVLGDSGWGGWIAAFMADQLSDSARELLEMVGRHVDPTEGLPAFLSQLEPLGKDLAAKETGGVRLMTVARSKGLTVNTAIVAGVEAGLFPMPPPKGQIDEERRLLYVAMTRATDVCILTAAKWRTGQLARMGAPNTGPRMRSPLLENLPIGAWTPGEPFVATFEVTHE